MPDFHPNWPAEPYVPANVALSLDNYGSLFAGLLAAATADLSPAIADAMNLLSECLRRLQVCDDKLHWQMLRLNLRTVVERCLRLCVCTLVQHEVDAGVKRLLTDVLSKYLMRAGFRLDDIDMLTVTIEKGNKAVHDGEIIRVDLRSWALFCASLISRSGLGYSTAISAAVSSTVHAVAVLFMSAPLWPRAPPSPTPTTARCSEPSGCWCWSVAGSSVSSQQAGLPAAAAGAPASVSPLRVLMTPPQASATASPKVASEARLRCVALSRSGCITLLSMIEDGSLLAECVGVCCFEEVVLVQLFGYFCWLCFVSYSRFQFIPGINKRNSFHCVHS